jgi:hypothetical protein
MDINQDAQAISFLHYSTIKLVQGAADQDCEVYLKMLQNHLE